MEEPYYLDPDRIAKLTDAQITCLYGRERDEKTGIPKVVGPEVRRKVARYEDAKASFTKLLAAFGKTPAEAEAAWEKGVTKGL